MHEHRLTPNQVVAHNLRAARELRGLTQAQAAALLEPHLGERWSPAVFSAAERSVVGKRIREFDADTLHAFSRAFDLPLSFFFIPPDAASEVAHSRSTIEGAGAAEVLAMLIDIDRPTGERMAAIERDLAPKDRARLIKLHDNVHATNVLAEMEQRLSAALENVTELRKLDAQLHPKAGR